VLAEQGVQGMRIEVLAKNFGVTKGSFYWHFKDRQDLFNAVLQTWRDGRIRDITSRASPTPGLEREQLLHLIDVYGATRNRKGISIELAVREWAGGTPRQQPSSRKSIPGAWNAHASCLSPAASPTSEAKSRSLLLYAYVFGQSLMACERYDPRHERLQALDCRTDRQSSAAGTATAASDRSCARPSRCFFFPRRRLPNGSDHP
jgi:AcrR family transcriptional regulator